MSGLVLERKDLASIWSPASQVSSHVGSAGVGVISLRGASLSLPTFATAQFKRFFDCGRAVRCMVASWFWSVYASCCFIRVFRVQILMLGSFR